MLRHSSRYGDNLTGAPALLVQCLTAHASTCGPHTLAYRRSVTMHPGCLWMQRSCYSLHPPACGHSHTRAHTYVHRYIDTYTHARTNAHHGHTYTATHMHVPMCAHIRVHIQAHLCTQLHTLHMCTHSSTPCNPRQSVFTAERSMFIRPWSFPGIAGEVVL